MFRLLVIFAMAGSPQVQDHKPVRTVLSHENTLYEVVLREPQERLIQRIVTRYKIDYDLAKDIVDLAHKHERRSFPKAKDILAIVAIESSFNPKAKSTLKEDPALGLMQIRAGVWKLPRKELLDTEKNIEHGATILEHYYDQLGRKRDSAVQSYNIGITAYLNGEKNPDYLKKYKREVVHYAQK